MTRLSTASNWSTDNLGQWPATISSPRFGKKRYDDDFSEDDYEEEVDADDGESKEQENDDRDDDDSDFDDDEEAYDLAKDALSFKPLPSAKPTLRYGGL